MQCRLKTSENIHLSLFEKTLPSEHSSWGDPLLSTRHLKRDNSLLTHCCPSQQQQKLPSPFSFHFNLPGHNAVLKLFELDTSVTETEMGQSPGSHRNERVPNSSAGKANLWHTGAVSRGSATLVCLCLWNWGSVLTGLVLAARQGVNFNSSSQKTYWRQKQAGTIFYSAGNLSTQKTMRNSLKHSLIIWPLVLVCN